MSFSAKKNKQKIIRTIVRKFVINAISATKTNDKGKFFFVQVEAVVGEWEVAMEEEWEEEEEGVACPSLTL